MYLSSINCEMMVSQYNNNNICIHTVTCVCNTYIQEKNHKYTNTHTQVNDMTKNARINYTIRWPTRTHSHSHTDTRSWKYTWIVVLIVVISPIRPKWNVISVCLCVCPWVIISTKLLISVKLSFYIFIHFSLFWIENRKKYTYTTKNECIHVYVHSETKHTNSGCSCCCRIT